MRLTRAGVGDRDGVGIKDEQSALAVVTHQTDRAAGRTYVSKVTVRVKSTHQTVQLGACK